LLTRLDTDEVESPTLGNKYSEAHISP
jgi:hypothetical protein